MKIYRDVHKNPDNDHTVDVVDEKAVHQGLSTLFNTRPGERLFNLGFGIDLDKFIFDLENPFTEMTIADEVETKVKQHDQRLEIFAQQIQIVKTSTNGLSVVVPYSIKGISGQHTYKKAL